MAEADALLLTRLLTRAIAAGQGGRQVYEAIPDDAPAPAVVNALVHRGRVTGDALPATVLDLAARDWIDLEQIALGEVLCRLPRVVPDDDPLAPHERRVLRLLEKRATRRTVPAGALTLGVEDERAEWWQRFSADVEKAATRTGLLAPVAFWSAGILILGFFGAMAVLLTGTSDGALQLACLAIAFGIGYYLAVAGIDRIGEPKLTRDGRAAAKPWRERAEELEDSRRLMEVPPSGVVVWERELAYAAALHRAPAATHGLPIGPDRTTSAWVRRGGMWQQVRVRYPRRFPPGWGRPPWLAGLVGAAGVAASAALLVAAAEPGVWHPAPPFSDDAARVIGDAEPYIAAVAAVLLVLSAWQLVAALLDAVRGPQTVTGEVVARRVRQGRRFNPWAEWVPRCWYVAIDDGMSRTIRGWQVTHEQFVTVRRGDRVEVRVGRALGNVDEIQRLAP